MRDLGIEFISVFGLPPVDFVHLAADLGCRYVSTALIGSPLKSLGYPSFSLRDDAQLWRELREIGPEVIGHVQLSDTTLMPRMKSYMEEAMYERMAPGYGELPLAELLAAVPTDVVVGLEIPMRSLAASGVGPIERLRPCVAAARELCSN